MHVHSSGSRLVDHAWLSTWVQAQHRHEATIRSYRQIFASHPANLLVVRDFLVAEVAEKLSRFLIDEARFETLHGLYSAMKNGTSIALVPEEDWLRASDEDRFFKLRKFTSLSPQLRLTPNLVTYLKFRTAFNDPNFREFFAQISGVPLDKNQSTYHSFLMKAGDFLRTHDDTDNPDYQIAFILYLSPDWKPGFGGALHMIDPSGDVSRIEPEYNSLVLFKVNPRTKHFIAPIDDLAGEKGRATISGWMHKPAPDLKETESFLVRSSDRFSLEK